MHLAEGRRRQLPKRRRAITCEALRVLPDSLSTVTVTRTVSPGQHQARSTCMWACSRPRLTPQTEIFPSCEPGNTNHTWAVRVGRLLCYLPRQPCDQSSATTPAAQQHTRERSQEVAGASRCLPTTLLTTLMSRVLRMARWKRPSV